LNVAQNGLPSKEKPAQQKEMTPFFGKAFRDPDRGFRSRYRFKAIDAGASPPP
jgi:hypothetical protein